MRALRRSERRPNTEVPPGTGQRPPGLRIQSPLSKEGEPTAGTVPGSDESNKRLSVVRAQTPCHDRRSVWRAQRINAYSLAVEVRESQE